MEYFVQTNHTKERPVMSILASIEHFVQQHFGDFFSSIEAFYLKNILILIQGILEPGHTSIS